MGLTWSLRDPKRGCSSPQKAAGRCGVRTLRGSRTGSPELRRRRDASPFCPRPWDRHKGPAWLQGVAGGGGSMRHCWPAPALSCSSQALTHTRSHALVSPGAHSYQSPSCPRNFSPASNHRMPREIPEASPVPCAHHGHPPVCPPAFHLPTGSPGARPATVPACADFPGRAQGACF